jgi:hypothetical protein
VKRRNSLEVEGRHGGLVSHERSLVSSSGWGLNGPLSDSDIGRMRRGASRGMCRRTSKVSGFRTAGHSKVREKFVEREAVCAVFGRASKGENGMG